MHLSLFVVGNGSEYVGKGNGDGVGGEGKWVMDEERGRLGFMCRRCVVDGREGGDGRCEE